MINKIKSPLIPVSWGEMIDKITILEIKKVNIITNNSQFNINKEIEYLNKILYKDKSILLKIKELKNNLFDINSQLWEVEDSIREKENKFEFDDEFIQLARSVYKLNDKRYDLKKKINIILESELNEEKSYKKYN